MTGMAALEAMIPVLVPVYVVVATGYFWARFGQPFEAPLVDALVHVVGLPCLILFTLARAELPLAELGVVLAAALIAFACFALLGGAALRLARLPEFPGRALVSLPMAGGIALPLAALGFGAKGLAYALVFMTVGAAANAALARARQAAAVPAILALAVAAALSGGGVALPGWAVNTARLLGGFVVAMQLISIGVTLARLRPAALPAGGALAVLRLGVGLGVGLGLAFGLGLDGAARAVVIVQCAMPVALAPLLPTTAEGAAPEPIASAFVVSTLLSLSTLPLLYLLAS